MRQSHMRCWMIVLLLIVVIGVLSSAPALVHEEDFSDNQDGWFVDQRMAIRNGRYEFHSTTGAAYAWRTRDIADGSLEVQAIWQGGLDSHG